MPKGGRCDTPTILEPKLTCLICSVFDADKEESDFIVDVSRLRGDDAFLEVSVFIRHGDDNYDKCLVFSIKGAVEEREREQCKTDFWVTVTSFFQSPFEHGTFVALMQKMIDLMKVLDEEWQGEYRLMIEKDMTSDRIQCGVRINIKALHILATTSPFLNTMGFLVQSNNFHDKKFTICDKSIRDDYQIWNKVLKMPPQQFTVTAIFSRIYQRLDEDNVAAEEVAFYARLIDGQVEKSSELRELLDASFILPPFSTTKKRSAYHLEAPAFVKQPPTLAQILTLHRMNHLKGSLVIPSPKPPKVIKDGVVFGRFSSL